MIPKTLTQHEEIIESPAFQELINLFEISGKELNKERNDGARRGHFNMNLESAIIQNDLVIGQLKKLYDTVPDGCMDTFDNLMLDQMGIYIGKNAGKEPSTKDVEEIDGIIYILKETGIDNKQERVAIGEVHSFTDKTDSAASQKAFVICMNARAELMKKKGLTNNKSSRTIVETSMSVFKRLFSSSR